MITESKKRGCANFCDVGYNLITSQAVVQNTFLYENVVGAVGVHPAELVSKKKFLSEGIEIEKLLSYDKVVAVGEIGLDYSKNVDVNLQQFAFRYQLGIAARHKRPVLLHIRHAFMDAYLILKEVNFKNGGIVHCFTGSEVDAFNFISIGFIISFSGILTFRNGNRLRKIAELIDVNYLTVETDSPFLSPHRGKINLPSNVLFVVEELAVLKRIKVKEMADFVRLNALRKLGVCLS